MKKLLNVTKSLIIHGFNVNCNGQIQSRRYNVLALKNHDYQIKELQKNNIKNRSAGYHYNHHPEKVKQFVKARDGHVLCNFIDSKWYRNKLLEKVELKLPDDIAPKDIKFEHVIDCAQPLIKKCKKKVDRVQKVPEVPKPKKKRKKATVESIISVILKKKNEQMVMEYPRSRWQTTTIVPVVLAQARRRQSKVKQYRKKTTILPIILKKRQEKILNNNLLEKESFTNQKHNENIHENDTSKKEGKIIKETTKTRSQLEKQWRI